MSGQVIAIDGKYCGVRLTKGSTKHHRHGQCLGNGYRLVLGQVKVDEESN